MPTLRRAGARDKRKARLLRSNRPECADVGRARRKESAHALRPLLRHLNVIDVSFSLDSAACPLAPFARSLSLQRVKFQARDSTERCRALRGALRGDESRMRTATALGLGQVHVTLTNSVKYHGVAPPPPNKIATFLVRIRPDAVADAISAAAEVERWLIARRPVVALAHWRRRANERAGIMPRGVQ